MPQPSQIQITKTFASISPQDLRVRAERTAKDLSEKLKLSWAWTSPTTIDFKGEKFPSKGVVGRLTVSGSTVGLSVTLPSMLAAMAGSKIESEARSYIDAIDAGG